MDQKSPEAFRTISEVSEWLDTPAHVLRFWESRFAQVKPVKRAGGRRYYRPADMALLGGIKKLLHEDGMTIRGVQKILRSEGVRHVAALSPPVDDLVAPGEEAEVDIGEEAGGVPETATALEPVPADEPAPAPAASEEAGGEQAGSEEAGSEEASGEKARAGDEREPKFSFAPAQAAPATPATPPPAAPATPPPEAESDFLSELEEALGGDGGAVPPVADAPPAAPARPRPDLSAIAEVPADDDPGFAAKPSGFPLRDPRAARTRLAGQPAKAAALYERLLALRERLGEHRR